MFLPWRCSRSDVDAVGEQDRGEQDLGQFEDQGTGDPGISTRGCGLSIDCHIRNAQVPRLGRKVRDRTSGGRKWSPSHWFLRASVRNANSTVRV